LRTQVICAYSRIYLAYEWISTFWISRDRVGKSQVNHPQYFPHAIVQVRITFSPPGIVNLGHKRQYPIVFTATHNATKLTEFAHPAISEHVRQVIVFRSSSVCARITRVLVAAPNLLIAPFLECRPILSVDMHCGLLSWEGLNTKGDSLSPLIVNNSLSHSCTKQRLLWSIFYGSTQSDFLHLTPYKMSIYSTCNYISNSSKSYPIPAILSICYICLYLISRLVWNATYICGSSSVTKLYHPEYWSNPEPFTESWTLLAIRDFNRNCNIFEPTLDKMKVLRSNNTTKIPISMQPYLVLVAVLRKQYLKLIHWIYFHCEG